MRTPKHLQEWHEALIPMPWWWITQRLKGCVEQTSQYHSLPKVRGNTKTAICYPSAYNGMGARKRWQRPCCYLQLITHVTEPLVTYVMEWHWWLMPLKAVFGPLKPTKGCMICIQATKGCMIDIWMDCLQQYVWTWPAMGLSLSLKFWSSSIVDSCWLLINLIFESNRYNVDNAIEAADPLYVLFHTLLKSSYFTITWTNGCILTPEYIFIHVLQVLLKMQAYNNSTYK